MHAEDNYVRNALDAGAKGYLLKSAIDVDLVGAIRAWLKASASSAPGCAMSHRHR